MSLFFDLHNFHSNSVTQNFIRAIFTLAPAQKGDGKLGGGWHLGGGESGGKHLHRTRKFASIIKSNFQVVSYYFSAFFLGACSLLFFLLLFSLRVCVRFVVVRFLFICDNKWVLFISKLRAQLAIKCKCQKF